MMRNLLKPHTRQWFGALARCNVWQAAVALQNIQWAGTRRVCSLCGKKGARDYRIDQRCFGKDQPVTMRLCKECFVDRQEVIGNQLTPLPA